MGTILSCKGKEDIDKEIEINKKSDQVSNKEFTICKPTTKEQEEKNHMDLTLRQYFKRSKCYAITDQGVECLNKSLESVPVCQEHLSQGTYAINRIKDRIITGGKMYVDPPMHRVLMNRMDDLEKEIERLRNHRYIVPGTRHCGLFYLL